MSFLHRLIMLIVLGSTIVSVNSLSFAQEHTDPEQDPTKVTEMWLAALVTGDGINIARYTCRAMRDEIQEATLMLNSPYAARRIGCNSFKVSKAVLKART
jgi:hypothetical protein